MAYIKTMDERYGGSSITGSAGDRDAPSYLNSMYVLAEGSTGYGDLKYQSYIADTDIQTLGVLNSGYYSVNVGTNTWDYSSYGSGGISKFQVLNSYGGIVETQYGTYADIKFSVDTSSTYYVKILGNYNDQQYEVTYNFDGNIPTENDVAVWNSLASYTGSLNPCRSTTMAVINDDGV